jgi:hypothetical protein
MAVSDDWDIDYICKQISHIDGNLDFDTATGCSPAADDYIYQTSGNNAVGKTLCTVSGASGTINLTNTLDRFVDGTGLVRLEYVDFDCVQNCGFSVGETLNGVTSSRCGIIRAIEYNTGTTAGQGRVYAQFCGGAGNFTCNEALQVGGSTKALAVGTGSGDFTWAASVNETTSCTLNPPGTNNTSQLFNFDSAACPIFIPEGATVGELVTAPTRTAVVQQHVGAANATKGTLRVVDVDNTPAWACNDSLFIQNVVFYDAQVAGQVFSVGDVVTGSTSGAQSRVLSIIDDGDCTGKLITAGIVGGPYCNVDNLQVSGVAKAGFENCSATGLDSNTDLLGAPRTRQRNDLQGGIYDDAVSLNIIRNVNALYTYLQDTFDELAQLDDPVPMSAQVKDQQYTLINSWQIPDLSMRFLENGSIQDSGNNNIFTNYQTLGSIEGIGDQGYIEDATTPSPQPQLYVEQNGVVLREDWLEGNINVLVKVKTSTDTTIIDPTVNALGQLIDSGTVTIFNRRYGHTYDHFETTTVGGTAPMPLATAIDANNATAQLRNTYTGCGGFTVGEEITDTACFVGVVVAECVTCNTLDYILFSACDIGGGLTVTGAVSAATAVEGTPSNLVAGYCAQVRQMTVELKVAAGGAGGCGTTGTWRPGETVTQAVTCATGFILTDDAADALYLEVTGCTAFSGNNTITGAVSAATYAPGACAVYTSNQTTVPGDLGEGSGEECYTGYIVGNHNAAACASPIAEIYEWTKFELRKESCLPIAGKGTAADITGNIYRLICSAYPEVKAAPFGTFAGGTMFGAQGIFICNGALSLLPADIQKVQLINNAGTTRNPPNFQNIAVTALVACDSVAVYRAVNACACSDVILTTQFDVGIGACDNQAADTTVVVGANTCTVGPLAQDIPCTGVLRVEDPNNAGIYLRMPYSALDRTTNTFTLACAATIGSFTTCTDLTDNDNIFVVYVEETSAGTSVSNSVIYVADRPLIVRVRRKGILPFETEATFGSTGASVGAVRTTDPVVDLP